MGIAVAGGGADLLSEKASMMRESLQKSQTITDNVVTILGSFDSRLSALETAMRPTQVALFFLPPSHLNHDERFLGKWQLEFGFKIGFWELGFVGLTCL